MDERISRRQMVGAAAALPLAAALPAFAKPAQSRLDLAKMAAIPSALQSYIDRGILAGVVTMTCHRGRIVQVNALGWRDLETRAPMQRDTLFRLASMTKPVTSAAVLMLMDEGKLKLSDPITKWIPELANRRVLRKADGPIEDTVLAHRDITVEDLLTHRAGLGLPFILTGPISQAYEAAIGRGRSFGTTDEWLAALGTLPLLDQPGERMQYGVATDVLGFLIERVEGKTLQDVLQARIFAPLGMKDTDFWVPPVKQNRLASLYQFDEKTGALGKVPDSAILTGDVTHPPAVLLGAGGLVSSADDYMAFARMLMGGGGLGRVRLLKPETVRDMATNRLTTAQRQFPFIGLPLWQGMGFGLGVAIVEERRKTNISNGSVGSYGWPGAWGTWWQNDPAEDLTMVYMIQQAYPLTPNSGAVLAGGRGVAHREALPLFERMTYEAVGSPPP
ncbi:serine hydrolase domain-containing protein [Rhizorhapis suberifaciens]|uniref:CubicO group peptidase (Beta-lactamase class C family) n=1 Tax=Rhizorhapis suberifaciens TaxID=13656 RepID=A0A840HZR7_9SPHN|nr:serine hydrolase domain-containing protein [Rhizorhapis suberifaciens]MBB4642906.1 CubicO group peptidase (beta-lactamase class C family) [Rhizorhapis suberifaciens]